MRSSERRKEKEEKEKVYASDVNLQVIPNPNAPKSAIPTISFSPASKKNVQISAGTSAPQSSSAVSSSPSKVGLSSSPMTRPKFQPGARLPAALSKKSVSTSESSTAQNIILPSSVRTYRIWHPSSRRKSVVVNIGSEKDAEERSSKVFDSKNMRSKNFEQWRKEAKSQLPSITGGVPIETIEELVEGTPQIQKDDIRTAQQTIRRLSQDSGGGGGRTSLLAVPGARKGSADSGRDYAAPRTQRRTFFEEVAGTILDLDSDSEVDEDELERQQAGTDIRGKIQTLKELGEHLSHKRLIRQQLVEKATGGTVLDPEEIPIREHVLYILEIIHQMFNEFANRFVIWESDIALINGRFGAVISSYFIWLRRLLMINVLYLLIALFVVVLPQIIDDAKRDEPYPDTLSKSEDFHFGDLIHGEGSFQRTYMYYSGYHAIDGGESPFHEPAFRFLFAIFLMFVLMTYLVFSRINKYYHSVRMESKVSGVAKMINFKATICAWDFSCSDFQASIYLHKAIRRELNGLAVSSRGEKHFVEIEAEHKAVLVFFLKRYGDYWGPKIMHVIANIILFGCCIVLGLVLDFLIHFKLDYYLNCVGDRDDGVKRTLSYSEMCPNGDLYLQPWVLSLPAVFASVTWIVLSKLIILIGESESWESAESRVYAVMVRVGIFDLTNIAVFYLFWVSVEQTVQDGGFVTEDLFGKALYRLVVIQWLADVGINFGLKGIYHMCRRNSKTYKLPEFRSEYCALSIFIMHSISGMGMLFCPLISLFVILRLIADFYRQKFSLLHMHSQETYSSHASSVYAPYLVTYFVSYLVTSSLNVYYLSQKRPSNLAGPFTFYNVSYDGVLLKVVSSGRRTNFLKNLAQPGFLLTFVVIIGALAYFCREWARAYDPIIAQLNELILLERGDRDVLLKAIFDFGKKTTAPSSGGATTETMSVVSIIPEEEPEPEHGGEVVDAQINKLIKHVQGRRSLDVIQRVNPGDGTATATAHRNVAIHHKEHITNLVAGIVGPIMAPRKSRRSLIRDAGKNKVKNVESVPSKVGVLPKKRPT